MSKEPPTCAECGKPLAELSVTSVDGTRRHPDCYDKWRDGVLKAMGDRGDKYWGRKASA